ncbi:MAG: ArsB/NhaD family transporter [Acidobacteriota bacterium]
MTSVAAFSILALTVSLSLSRPSFGAVRIRHAEAGVIGAALVLLLGIVPPDLALVTLRRLSLPVVTIVGLMVISLVAERAGLLGLVAQWMARAAKGNGGRLFTYLFFCGTLVGTIFTNDAAVLIFTPLVFGLMEEIQEDSWSLRNKIPFYFAVLYVGNLVGALVISNPINIIVSSLFGIRFLEYAIWMIAPAVVSMVVSFAGLKLFFRNLLPGRYRFSEDRIVRPKDRRFAVLSGVILFATLLGFFSEDLTGIPTWLVALLGALTLLGVNTLMGYAASSVLKLVGWDVIVFVVGIFIVSTGLRNVGLTHYLGWILAQLSESSFSQLTFATGFVAAICSSIMNNHPTAGLMTWVIQDFSLSAFQTKMLVFSALIGGDLGPKMLPIGSLAALMWFRMLRDRGIHISYSLYIKIGIPVTLVAILLSIVTLNIELLIYYWWTS